LNDKVKQVVWAAIEAANKRRPKDKRIAAAEDTRLLGSGSKLDSLGLVQFVVVVESEIEKRFGSTPAVSEKLGQSGEMAHFETVGSLCRALELWLEADGLA
jgi:acyl carrier protein